MKEDCLKVSITKKVFRIKLSCQNEEAQCLNGYAIQALSWFCSAYMDVVNGCTIALWTPQIVANK